MTRIAALILLPALAGCPNDDEQCVAPEPTLESLHAEVFDGSCALSGSCHNDTRGNPEPIYDGDREDGSFDLTDPEDICQYLDVPAVSDSEHRPLIVSGNCQDSYMMVKVDPARESEITTSDEQLAARGGRESSGMPQRSIGVTGTRLCQAKIDALCQWIDLGTPGCD